MSLHFIPCDRKTPFLPPPSIDAEDIYEDWWPEGHRARFVVEVVFTTQPSFLKRFLCRSQSPTIQPGDADSGYFSKSKVAACERQELKPYIAVDREDYNEPLWRRFQEPPPLPDNADAGTKDETPAPDNGRKSRLWITQDNLGSGFWNHQGSHGIQKLPEAWFCKGTRGMESCLHCLAHQNAACHDPID